MCDNYCQRRSRKWNAKEVKSSIAHPTSAYKRQSHLCLVSVLPRVRGRLRGLLTLPLSPSSATADTPQFYPSPLRPDIQRMNNGQGNQNSNTQDMGLSLIPADGLINVEQYERNAAQIANAYETLALLQQRNDAGYQRYVALELQSQVEAGRRAQYVPFCQGFGMDLNSNAKN